MALSGSDELVYMTYLQRCFWETPLTLTFAVSRAPIAALLPERIVAFLPCLLMSAPAALPPGLLPLRRTPWCQAIATQ
jgi:hypothetical protein